MTNQEKFEKYHSICLSSNINAKTKAFEVDPCSVIAEVPGGLSHMLYRNAYKQHPHTCSVNGSYNIDLFDVLNNKGIVINSTSNVSSSYAPDDIVEWMQMQRIYEVGINVWVKVCVVLEQKRNAVSKLEINDVSLLHDNSTDLSWIFNMIKSHEIHEVPTPCIGIIKQSNGRLYISDMEMSDKQTYSENYYNEDFPEFLEDMTCKLQKNEAGLFLLHGEPGTGKSSAIRYLIKQLYDTRRFVFVPPHMTHSLALPEFADLLTGEGKGSVLVVEDAEKALMKREGADGFHNSELVSSVLNLTDGLYADITKTAIIATYNCDRSNIDTALLRKGRLKSEYEFKKLSADKAQALADELNNGMVVDDDTTLADVFNYGQQFSNSENINKPKRVVGFGS